MGLATPGCCGEMAGVTSDFLIVCLCAAWCKACREYQPDFEALSAEFQSMTFRWVDVEDHADVMGDLDIVDFPTLLVFRQSDVLFFGAMRPETGHLRRLIEVFDAQTPLESHDYAISSGERLNWQKNEDLLALRASLAGEHKKSIKSI